MKRKAPVVVVDADAIVAQAHPGDSNHEKAMQVAQKLLESNAQMIYPASTICEAVTVLQHKLSSTATAYGTAVVFTDSHLQVVEINHKILNRSIHHYFKQETSKKNTLFDCIVLDTAEQYKADAIFSFDHFYRSKGYTLATEFVKSY